MSQSHSVLLQELRSADDEVHWRAVQTRDGRFNGAFVYGVRATGIYCQPSCPSRRPRREQVAFFTSWAAAEQGGFRACRRCQPRRMTALDPHVELILRACRALEAGATEKALPLQALGAELGVSPHHLQRTFKSVTGVTPRRYAAALRLQRFKSCVKEGGDVAGALYEAGYGSSSRLYEEAPARLGMTPAAYRRGGRGMPISYAIVDSHLGRLLVAATERGVCAVSFGDDDNQLEAYLAAEYPAASIQRDEARLSELADVLLDHLKGARPHLDLPLDVQATAFQLRVWEELWRIPCGATRSYAEIAQAINRPTATRAVAGACASNRVALVTPCHRVVRQDGQPGGYRWGVARKEKLLAEERKRTAETSSDARE